MVGPPVPRDEDMLLLWSYELPIYGETLPQELSKYDGQMRSARLVGITFLSKHAIELLDK
jgi:hypothetical protein